MSDEDLAVLKKVKKENIKCGHCRKKLDKSDAYLLTPKGSYHCQCLEGLIKDGAVRLNKENSW